MFYEENKSICKYFLVFPMNEFYDWEDTQHIKWRFFGILPTYTQIEEVINDSCKVLFMQNQWLSMLWCSDIR